MSDALSDRNAPAEPKMSEDVGPPPAHEIPDEESTSLPDKAIAFGILALPFSWLLVWIRDQLEAHVSKSVNNIVLLVGIVAFLLLVGKVAERVRDYRKEQR